MRMVAANQPCCDHTPHAFARVRKDQPARLCYPTQAQTCSSSLAYSVQYAARRDQSSPVDAHATDAAKETHASTLTCVITFAARLTDPVAALSSEGLEVCCSVVLMPKAFCCSTRCMLNFSGEIPAPSNVRPSNSQSILCSRHRLISRPT